MKTYPLLSIRSYRKLRPLSLYRRRTVSRAQRRKNKALHKSRGAGPRKRRGDGGGGRRSGRGTPSGRGREDGRSREGGLGGVGIPPACVGVRRREPRRHGEERAWVERTARELKLPHAGDGPQPLRGDGSGRSGALCQCVGQLSSRWLPSALPRCRAVAPPGGLAVAPPGGRAVAPPGGRAQRARTPLSAPSASRRVSSSAT